MKTVNETETLKTHENLIAKIAKKYRGLGVPFDDLVQEASISFIRSLRTWRESGGASHGTYTRGKVDLATRDAVRNEKRKQPELTALSLDVIEEGGQHHDQLAEEASQENKALCSQLLSRLDDQQRRIVTMHVVEGEDFRAIGMKLSLSKSQVDRIYREALQTMRDAA